MKLHDAGRRHKARGKKFGAMLRGRLGVCLKGAAIDRDMKAFAEKTTPTLKMHLQMIRDIAAKMGVNAKP